MSNLTAAHRNIIGRVWAVTQNQKSVIAIKHLANCEQNPPKLGVDNMWNIFRFWPRLL